VPCGAHFEGEYTMAKNKHLTDSERLEIEQWLRDGISIKQIAVKLWKKKDMRER
jgi:IS30 family transposase